MPRKLSSFSRFYLNALSPDKGFRNDCNPPLVPSGLSLSPHARRRFHSPCLCLRPVPLCSLCPRFSSVSTLVDRLGVCSSLSLSTSTRNSVGFGLSDRRMDWIENGTRSGQVCYRGNAIQKLNSVCTVD